MAANWQHKGNGDWHTAANWVGNSVPTGGDVTLDYSQLSPFTAAYTVTIAAAGSFGLNDLTINGTSTTSVIALANSGTLVVLDQAELHNASITDGKSLTVGTLGFNGDALLTLGTFATASGQVTSSGSANEVLQTFDSKFVGATANFGGPFTWVLQGMSQASFSGQVAGSGATFVFADNTADELTLGSGQGNELFSAISSFSSGNVIDLRGLSFGAGGFSNNTSGMNLVISRGGQPQFKFDTFSFATGFNLSEVRYSSDGNGGTLVSVVCFAAGTRIAAEHGDVAVEKLHAGDRVLTLEAGSQVLQTVRWVGRRRLDLGAHPNPALVAPVRIRAGAFADGVPHRDLMVSPDHAILTEGGLMMARQLINHGTICQETDTPSVEYFHVALDRHAILLAEGLPAESYLDTGNRGFFDNGGEPLVLHPDLTDETGYPTREANSCAPFVWDEASVRPVWQRLADRAAAIGRPLPPTTADADLRLLTKRGTHKPIYSDSNRVIFILPRDAPEVRLLSRAQSPTEARPWLEDRRRLGVRVKRIVLRGGDQLREVPVDHPDLTRGWWGVERDGQAISRWTDGDAVLPLPATSGIVMLEIHLAGSMIYAVDAASEGGMERRAAA